MDTLVPQRIESAYDKGRVLRLSIMMLVIAAAIAIAPLLPEKPGQSHPSEIVFWPIAALCCYLVVVLLLKIAKGEPALIMSTAGIYIENYVDETIPWRAVRNVRRYQRRSADQVYVDLDPAVARTLTRRGFMCWLPRALRGQDATAVISLKLLRSDPDWIYNRCMDFLARARDREQQALGDDDSPAEARVEGDAEPIFTVKGPPLFTYALIAILVLVYLGELKFGVVPPKDDAPTTQTLLALGGMFHKRIVQYDEWWRLVTAAFLHGSVIHLTFNCLALWQAGILLERLIGWRWFAGLFCISAIGGSAASLLINPSNMVGVGASGGIIGLFAAAIVASFHFPSGPLPSILRIGAIQILIPSLLPFLAQTVDGMQIDYSAHLGGALAGGAVSLALLQVWPRQRFHPRFGMAALVGSIAFAVIAVGSLWPISQLRAGYLSDPFAQYFQRQYQLAADDFAASARSDEKAAPYYYLWRFIALTRGNDNRAAIDFRDEAGKLDQGKWPYPVYKLFFGELSPEEVVAKATTNDSLCEAIFYIGEWHLLRGETADAKQKFKAALSSCPTNFMEYGGARGELFQLGQQ